MTAIVWFRRDLRLHDHPALTSAVSEHEHVVPAFVLDPTLLSGRFHSASRVTFMLECLRELDRSLRERGSALHVRSGAPETVLPELARESRAEIVVWTSDVAPYARARDRRVTAALREAGVVSRPHGGNYIADISKITTTDGRPFTVFSPFQRRWVQAERRVVLPAPERVPPAPARVRIGRLPHTAAELDVAGPLVGSQPIVPPGEAAARAAFERWLDGAIDHYADRHDGMARIGTSQLSPYLRWGCLSPRELEERARAHVGAGASAWVRQLAWREFYAHVLLNFPGNTGEALQPRFRELTWDDAPDRLECWQQGGTGYPIVDAGMRQLSATGWMHNRARLIVGSFLTKDLHIDWREGERWFERLLLDGEPAQNNGNWQWIASVGTDPAPAYRRMYNPTLQAQRFDPHGGYIRQWVPELADVPDAYIFEPWRMDSTTQREAQCVLGRDYPAPIVEHATERRIALERYRTAGQGANATTAERL